MNDADTKKQADIKINAYCPICDKERYISKPIGYCSVCGHHLNQMETINNGINN